MRHSRNAYFALLSFAVVLAVAPALKAVAQNTLAGTVYDNANQALADIDIELQDEYGRLLRYGRQKTDSTGRFEFTGLNNGRYYLHVYAFRYDLNDEEREVTLGSVSAIPGQPGSSYNVEDFHLTPRKGSMRELEASLVFAQEVPKEAEREYKQALDAFSKKNDDAGLAGLQRAITAFPKYYAALMRMGAELHRRRMYLEATHAYLLAADAQPKSGSAFYNAALSLYAMGDKYYKAALTPANEASRLVPNSAAVLLLLGTLERHNGDLANAEKHLLAAKKASPVKVPEIHRELSQLYDEQKRYSEAADELEQYIKASKISGEDEAKIRKIVQGLRDKAKAKG